MSSSAYTGPMFCVIDIDRLMERRLQVFQDMMLIADKMPSRRSQGSIVRKRMIDGVLHELHATKGWRKRRVVPARVAA